MTAQQCQYCGLPVRAPARKERLRPEAEAFARDEPCYCCWGCQFAAGIWGDADQGQGGLPPLNGLLIKLATSAILSLNVMMMSMVLWTPDAFGLGVLQTPGAHAWFTMIGFVQLAMTALVLVLLIPPLLDHAMQEGAERRWSVELLLCAGVLAAFVYSCVQLSQGGQHLYFEVVCAIPLSVTIGRWLEAHGKQQACAALQGLGGLLPETAWVMRDGIDESLPLPEVAAGSLVRVLPQQRIPLDGVIRQGASSVDERLFTGEAFPVNKQAGDAVRAGSLNCQGNLLVEVTQPHGAGELQQMESLVKQALLVRTQWQQLADSISGWFLPLVGVLALFTVCRFWSQGPQAALLTGLSVVIIACPCALGLATPLAIWSAISSAAQRGILFKSGDALAKLASVNQVFFDKTGTLTTGAYQPGMVLTNAAIAPQELLRMAAALAIGSQHPLSCAIVAWQGKPARLPREMVVLSGQGISGEVPQEDGTHLRVVLGSWECLESQGLVEPPLLRQQRLAIKDQAGPRCGVGWGGTIQGWLHFKEAWRDDLASLLAWLNSVGIGAEVLSGDPRADAASLTAQLQMPVQVGRSAEQKQQTILQAKAKQLTVAMVGDGVNDSPALASADVGITMGCGGDLARSSASVCLLSNQLSSLVEAIQWARIAQQTVRENLLWAFLYNLIALIVAMQGWLTPLLAAPVMLISSAVVVRSSLRLPGRVARLADRHHEQGSTHPAPVSRGELLLNTR